MTSEKFYPDFYSMYNEVKLKFLEKKLNYI